MNVSHPSVHPLEAPPLTGADNDAPPRVRMKDIQGMPGTVGGLMLRCCQFAFAVVALCVMATTSDFPSVTAFWYMISFYWFLVSDTTTCLKLLAWILLWLSVDGIFFHKKLTGWYMWGFWLTYKLHMVNGAEKFEGWGFSLSVLIKVIFRSN